MGAGNGNRFAAVVLPGLNQQIGHAPTLLGQLALGVEGLRLGGAEIVERNIHDLGRLKRFAHPHQMHQTSIL